MKKIITSSLLLASSLFAEIEQKGFYVALDYAKASITSDYLTSGSMSFNDYTNSLKNNKLGYKIGYQYYFTRIYFRYSTFNLKDEKKGRYQIDGKSYEAYAEYLPIFYTAPEKSWVIRGTLGAMIGYTRASLKDNYRPNILPAGITASSQNNFLYGVNIGLLYQNEYGINLEMGMRYKKGNSLEFADENSNAAVFRQKIKEFYIGVGYLF